MRYKKQIATGALAISLLVGGFTGIVSTTNNKGFVIEIKNMKTKTASSADVWTDNSTTFSKNGMQASAADLNVGQKVVVIGKLDKTTNLISAKKVKIVAA